MVVGWLLELFYYCLFVIIFNLKYMLFLAEFSVMNPSLGLLFWTAIIFVFVLLVLSRFFKTIKNALKKRETDIETALNKAEEARKEIAEVQNLQKKMESEAAEIRLKIIREAEAIRDKIIEEAKSKAEEATRSMLESARIEIANRQKEMEISMMNEVGKLSVDIAQQVLQMELQNRHEDFIASKINEFKKSSLN